MNNRKWAFCLTGILALCLAGCGAAETANTAAAGEDWAPSGTVSVIVPASAGGNTDVSARIFAEYAHKLTGNEFAVVNVSGSAGTVAANQVLAARPDGYTFLYGHNLVNMANIAGVTDYHYSAFTLGPTLMKDPAQQFYVNAGHYQDLASFIEAAKAAPGRLKACTEVGAYTYYELLAFEQAAGIDLELVDVGSNANKVAAMLSGQAELMPGAYGHTKEYLENGQFICLGVPSKERYTVLSAIPTLKEQGIDFVYPDCDFSFYFPKDTPEEIIAYYEELAQKILDDPEAQEAIARNHMIPYYLSAEESQIHDEEIFDEVKGIVDGLD